MGHEKAQNGQKGKLSMRAVQPDKAVHATMTNKEKSCRKSRKPRQPYVC